MGILGQHFGTPPQLLEHHPIENSGSTFRNTTPTFGTPPHRAVGILGQFFGTPPHLFEHHPIEYSGTTFGAPPRLLEHHPIEPRGFWDNLLEHHPNFWNTTPSTQQREHQPSRVGVLVQPLEHHPTEPQGPDHESGTLTGGTDQPLVAARNNHVCTTFR